MSRRINRSMLLLVVISVLLFSVGSTLIFYNSEKTKTIQLLNNQINYISTNLDNINYDNISVDLIMSNSRVSIIDESGNIIYDNKISLNNLDNHNDRSEVIEARNSGIGEMERYSDSFMEKYYYQAILLDNNYVLRISESIKSIYSLFILIFPFIFLASIIIIAIATLISKRLTKKIVEPIIKADLQSALVSPYVELDLYFSTMRQQKSEINRQMLRVNKRNDTINTILNSMSEGIIIVNRDKKVVLANKAFLKLVNQQKYQVSDSVFKYINDREILKKLDEFSLDNSSFKYEINESVYQVFINYTKIQDEEVLILLFVDISLEFENEKYRRTFSANVSHELKTPLTIIKGYSELLANSLVNEDDIEYFGKKILNQSDRLLELIEHNIKLSQFDEDLIDKDESLINLKTLVIDVISHLNEKITKKNIELKLDLDDVYFKGNYNMLDEMFYNLIENAIKYNYDNGIIEISIKSFDKIYISIKNTGDKIKEKDIPYLFERFYRVDSSRNKKTGGSGLGLSIVKHIIKYHNGEISVVSDKFNEFIISF